MECLRMSGAGNDLMVIDARGLAQAVPYIFEEEPELKAQFDGFTFVELNKRNEALKVMPVLFDEKDFVVTVPDPVYANCRWIPDLSIDDQYPDTLCRRKACPVRASRTLMENSI